MKAATSTRAQSGAITLLVAIGLVVLATLTSFYSNRSVLMDQLAGQNHERASQARLAAEAALAEARSCAALSSVAQPVSAAPTPIPTTMSAPSVLARFEPVMSIPLFLRGPDAARRDQM